MAWTEVRMGAACCATNDSTCTSETTASACPLSSAFNERLEMCIPRMVAALTHNQFLIADMVVPQVHRSRASCPRFLCWSGCVKVLW